MFTSTDSTAMSAIDGNSNSFSWSATSSTAPNCQPNHLAHRPFSGDFANGPEKQPSLSVAAPQKLSQNPKLTYKASPGELIVATAALIDRLGGDARGRRGRPHGRARRTQRVQEPGDRLRRQAGA
ncbi:hypothetical protein [Streptomyces sp. PSKA30]|uniref:hypothetical protein n=1 Tax=Streptomyces sp. PSKA30 TaxID=2874597 RepID=UPI001CD07952|nr:hypothetical protein [Streptomyces sp. PSKA30]MBZ9644096.1 hypothetical protein [Streptomyces sp. PSKA30]